MIPGWLLVLLTAMYLGGLFAVAAAGDRHSLYTRSGRWRSTVYGLSLGVYCTTWTFYGAVGMAVRDGWAYLPIYIGPVLVWVCAVPLLRRLIDVGRARNITSVADLLASRFGKSRALAAIATTLSLLATVPYVALQYKALTASIEVLTAGSPAVLPLHVDYAFVMAMVLALFGVLFGARSVSATDHRDGLVLAVALESVVKLAAFAAVGLWALSGHAAESGHLAALISERRAEPDLDFFVTCALSMAAVIFLPRQFQVSVVECVESGDAGRARWIFPLYLVVVALLVIPVAGHGIAVGTDIGSADRMVLALPMAAGRPLLALVVFLGGVSAATAMVIVASVALSTMISNDLLLPVLLGREASSAPDLGRRVLRLRRQTHFVVALLAYGFYRLISSPVSLASIGLMAFAAVAQFVPGVLAALYWRGATRRGVVAGLSVGSALWIYTIFIPSMLNPATPWLLHGPFDVLWLRPASLFGTGATVSAVTHGAIWSLAGNLVALALLSWRRVGVLHERLAANAFLQPAETARGVGHQRIRVSDLTVLASRIVGESAARRIIAEPARQAGLPVPQPSDIAERGLLQHVEREIAGSVGASSARVLMTRTLSGRGIDLDEVGELLDETSQQLRFSRELLQATMENVTQGISVVDAQLRLIAWNRRYVEMLDYPADLIQVGREMVDILRYNVTRCVFVESDAEGALRDRLERMQARGAYVIQRRHTDGRFFEIRGEPLPTGGYVTTYTDISEFKRQEDALLAAKAGLESRVSERTAALQQALEAAAVARQVAEEANASKTRFFAAASHDLLQPLNAARLFASALCVGAADGTEAATMASRIETSMRSAEDLLEQLLEIARLDSGQFRVEISDFALADLFADLEQQYSALAHSRGLRLRLRPTRAWVRTDRVLLRRILQNYLANALRYTEAGGILVGVRPRGGQWQISVADTGPGIDLAQQSLIFAEFTRLDRGSPWGERGLGLGLSICDRIARRLAHPLALHSRPGHGSVFSVVVPSSAIRAAPPLEAMRPVADGLLALTVLCIDNDPVILDGMRALLGRWGLQVRCARTTADAIVALAEALPDVILADQHLDGDERGIDFLAAQQTRLGRPLTVAMITADRDPDLAARARLAGWVVLRKPLRPAALRAWLASVRP